MRHEYQREYYHKNKDRLREKARLYRQNNKESIKFNRYLKRYGLTKAEYFDLLHAQDDTCPGCKIPFQYIANHLMHIDHDHRTGNVRGVLCHYCNAALGSVRDSVSTLTSLIKYLEKH